MSEVKKQEKDFTPEVEALVKEATELAKASTHSLLLTNASEPLSQNRNLTTAVEKLLVLEKQARNVGSLSNIYSPS